MFAQLNLCNFLTDFWRSHPALLYGLALLLGCASALQWNFSLLFPFALIFLPLLLQSADRACLQRLLLSLAIALAGFIYVKASYEFPQLDQDKAITGHGLFEISHFTTKIQYGNPCGLYRGVFKNFKSNGTIISRNIPCSINLNHRQMWPPADRSYQIKGTLIEIAEHRYILKPSKNEAWVEVPNSFSLAQLRSQTKRLISEYVHKNIQRKRSADFLTGIVTGEFADQMIANELGRFGLLHIMAISGFHFGIISAILGLLLCALLPRFWAHVLLIVLVSGYFLVLGNSPSIMRAWIACLVGLSGYLIERKSSGLNSLGIGLLVVLSLDPLAIHSIGFQFSFIATAGILIFYKPCDTYLQKLWSKRSLGITSRMDSMNQHGYCFITLLRQTIALSLAVNLAALPLTFLYFEKFPLMGLFYNLFFPAMVSLSMLLLIAAALINPVLPQLASLIHGFNDGYTDFMLNYAYNMPHSFDFIFRFTYLRADIIIVLMCMLYAFGIYCFDRKTLSEQYH